MKYDNKSELIEAIKNNANLFIKEYSDIEETSMNKIDEEIEYSPFQMLTFCIGWMDLVLAWEMKNKKGYKRQHLQQNGSGMI